MPPAETRETAEPCRQQQQQRRGNGDLGRRLVADAIGMDDPGMAAKTQAPEVEEKRVGIEADRRRGGRAATAMKDVNARR